MSTPFFATHARSKSLHSLLYGLLAAGLAFNFMGCGGGGGGGGHDDSTPLPEPATFNVGGGISGLTADGLVLRNNGANDLAITANATSFGFTVVAGGSYSISVATQPTGMNCSISNGTGSSVSAAVSSVSISCHPITHTIGGTISGLSMSGLVLRNNGIDDMAIAANATSFQFSIPVIAGSSYTITVATQPAGMTCTVGNGTGTNVSAAVSNVSVVCSPITHTVAGSISGLATSGLVLRNNGADDLAVAANATSFQFTTPIAAGGAYNVTPFAQPAGLTCSVSNGTGSNVQSDITSVSITCSTTTYTLGGTISGLNASGLVLQNNGGDNLTVASNATSFEFATPLAHGSSYTVTALTQPANTLCTITNASSSSITSDVTDVAISCTQTVLASSVSSLALAVDNTGINAALSGTPRTITITNSGSDAASNVSINYPTWPTGTTALANCGSTLAPASSCTITITPGTSATSNCDIGIAPTPGTITVSADNAADVTTDVVVLSYGCIYQGGYVFAVDDTTATTGSINGTVAATIDQAPAPANPLVSSNGVVWSSDGLDSTSPDFTAILGINQTSTTSSPSPTAPAYPMGTPAYTACNGASDGACNTANIVSYYNANRTTGGSAPTPLSDYAAGLCTATINSYSDWYLPAVCEMGYDNLACGGTTYQNMQANLADNNLGNLSNFYWSSTQASADAQNGAWLQYFDNTGNASTEYADKDYRLGVRCVRQLTP